jgi:hypothetical protein
MAAALCNIGGCGVIAFGRCSTCGRAFCTSHQAVASNGVTVVDQCSACHFAAGAAYRERVNRQVFGLGHSKGRDALIAANEPKVKLVTTTTEWQKKRFGRGESVTVVSPYGTGWLLGELPWRDTDANKDRIATVVLVDDPTVKVLSHCLKQVDARQDGTYEVLKGGRHGNDSGALDRISDAVRRLAGLD